MKAMTRVLIAGLLVCALASVNALASDSSGETAAPGQPFIHPSDDVSYSKDMQDDAQRTPSNRSGTSDVQYVSGGIGSGGMSAIKSEEQAYNLKMMFVSGAEYLANVGVRITDGKGNEMLDITTEGPVLLAKMPAGSYTVEATKAPDGTKLTQHVKVDGDRMASYVMRYPAGE